MKTAVNKFHDGFRARLRHPFSLLAFLLVWAAMLLTVAILAFIVIHILVNGIPYLTPSLFEWEYTSDNCSVVFAIINTLYIVGMALLIGVPIGIFAAIYLVEYAKRGNRVVRIIRLTTETLSGIPSIVYGLFGFIFFNNALGWGYSMMSGSFTVGIMILPLVIRSTEEALKSVPDSFREGSFGLGAGKLRTVFRVVLPSAIPGILAGIILAIGRVVGETAALIFTAGSITKVASGLFGAGRTLAIHMYLLSNEGLHVNESYATAVVLLVTVLLINLLASFVAKKLQKKF